MLGNMLGKGYTIKSAKAEMTMVAEGYYAAALVSKIRKKQEVRMPIVKAVYEVMYEGKSAKKTMAKLVSESQFDCIKKRQAAHPNPREVVIMS